MNKPNSSTPIGNDRFDQTFSTIEQKIFNPEYKEELEKLIKEEAYTHKMLSKVKDKISSISLYEKIEEDKTKMKNFYEWNNLFSKSRPLHAYTTSNLHDNKPKIYKEKITSNYKKLHHVLKESNVNYNNKIKQYYKLEKRNINDDQVNNQIKTDETIKKKNEFKFPIALIDADEDFLKQMDIGTIVKPPIKKRRNKNNDENKTIVIDNNQVKYKTVTKKEEINCVRPQSVYSPKDPRDTFYMSKTSNDYFTMDFFEFAKYVKILQAKYHQDDSKLKNVLSEVLIFFIKTITMLNHNIII